MATTPTPIPNGARVTYLGEGGGEWISLPCKCEECTFGPALAKKFGWPDEATRYDLFHLDNTDLKFSMYSHIPAEDLTLS